MKAPTTYPILGEHLTMEEVISNPLAENGCLDPYLRGRVRPGVKSYIAAFKLGDPISSRGVTKVIGSSFSSYKEGDILEFSSLSLGALDVPGLTAYASLFETAKPLKGETIFVSTASGAVGQTVGQISKLQGPTQLDAALKALKPHGCIVYLTRVGFIVGELIQRSGPRFYEKMHRWIHDGVIKTVISETDEIDNATEGLVGMFYWKPFGKAILKI
ncbi:hypothetical protein BGW36DRAFT_400105 [Talaromyces proteolyticus]|uniref:Oxidoreductase N-terminal domain-containing protein n=1 Tax=Talaromyces proteolyticus TaxID=1131652 RepID=A0AAD4KHR1_9EURO|nr:uncharacterized protein BGW36DRAFT_400105 [Talaromyces proteolyticus]KAH8691996.1 hypothetical protein BGW36DRAFT_400105 [Talaromyces proteolyticus]